MSAGSGVMMSSGVAMAMGGVWIAYYSDRSGFAVFPTEIEALRHAVKNTMQVKFQEWGEVILR